MNKQIVQTEFTWHQTVSGAYVNGCEQTLYDHVVVDLFGFNALQVGGGRTDFLKQSRIMQRYKALALTSSVLQSTTNQLWCDDDFLPFAEMSMDVLLLPHRLEFSARPHQTLREAFRVLVPDGYVLISGFNPWSLWGIKHAFKRFCKVKHYPWNGRFISIARLKDWLSVLDFEVLHCDFVAHVPPFERASSHKRFKWMDTFIAKYLHAFGGVYFIVAKKRVIGLTPIKPKWQNNVLKTVLAGQKNKNIQSRKKQCDIKRES